MFSTQSTGKIKRIMEQETTDGGSWYSTVLLIATTLTVTIYIGCANSFGIIYKQLLDFYSLGSGNTALINSINLFLNFAVGPFANYLAEVYSFSCVIFIGGAVSSLGMLLSAYMPCLEYWYITFSIITGFGYGLVYSPTFTVISFYFKQRRALAVGVMYTGSGIGSVVFPFIYTYLIDQYGLQGAIMIVSAISLNICVFASVIRQPTCLRRSTQTSITYHAKESYEKDSNCNKHMCKFRRPIFHLNLFTNVSYTVYCFAFACNIFAFLSNFVMIPGHGRHQKLSNDQITVCFAVAGGLTLVARPFFGWFADKEIVAKRNIIACCCVISGISCFVIPFFSGYIPLIIYSGVVGIFPGIFFQFIPLLLLEILPLKKLPQAQGLVYLCLSFPIGLAQAVVGWIEDHTGDWNSSFRFTGTICLLAGIIFATEPLFVRILENSTHKNQEKQKELNEEETMI